MYPGIYLIVEYLHNIQIRTRQHVLLFSDVKIHFFSIRLFMVKHIFTRATGGGRGTSRWEFFASRDILHLEFVRNFPHNFHAAVQNEPSSKFHKISCPTVA